MDMNFSLAVPGEAPTIPLVRRVVGDVLRGLGAAEDCVGDLLIALSEACTNAVQHGRGDYEVAGVVDGDSCYVRIMDWGRGASEASLTSDRGDLAESGRGIRIMRALVDEVTIDPATDRGTIVHLRKRLTWRDGAVIRRLDRRLTHSAG
jgi:serine/threonine-protein kinase RsbW